MGVRCLLISGDNSVILVKHRYQPGWHMPGGGMNPGETTRSALQREVREEAGIDIIGEPKLHGVFFNDAISKRDHVSVYISNDFKKIPNVKLCWEISECRSFPIEELPTDIEPGTKSRIQEALGQRKITEFWRSHDIDDSKETSKSKEIPLRSLLLGLTRKQKVVFQVIYDVIVLLSTYSFSLYMAAGDFSSFASAFSWKVAVASIITCVLLFNLVGIYRSIVRYTTASTLARLLIGCSAFAFSAFFISHYFDQSFTWATAVDLALIGGALTIGGRFVARSFLRAERTSAGRPVVIYGAGEYGRQLLTSLQQGKELNPVAFVDQNEELDGAVIGGVKVFSHDYLMQLIRKSNAETILVATREVSRQTQKDLADVLIEASVSVQSIPAVSDILSGRAKITDFRDVKIEELLGREPVPPIPNLMTATIEERSVAVTGAGGSIGSEICRQVLRLKPRKLLLIDHSEPALFAIENELNELARKDDLTVPVIATLGSISNSDLLTEFFAECNTDTIFHAAAFKHVPMLESNILSGLQNNIFGTASVLEAAIASSVASFTMISTDKAVRPTNVMGATKRAAELVCQARSQGQDKTTISMVRFGNVLGSSGSVIPLFRQQIAQGGPVTVTHKEITRYFMTIPEAAQLVIQSSGMARGGEVFLLNMGAPVKILDLAQSMIRLSGYQPFLTDDNTDRRSPSSDEIEIVISGLRPGEKLYEELLVDADAIETEHPRIMMAKEQFIAACEVERYLSELTECIKSSDSCRAVDMLKQMPLKYSGVG